MNRDGPYNFKESIAKGWSTGAFEADDSDADGESDTEGKKPESPPNKAVLKLYEDAGPSIKELIKNPHKSKSLLMELKKINEDIKEQDKKDESKTDHTIEGEVFINQALFATQEPDEDTHKYYNRALRCQKQLANYNKVHYFPEEWNIKLPEAPRSPEQGKLANQGDQGDQGGQGGDKEQGEQEDPPIPPTKNNPWAEGARVTPGGQVPGTAVSQIKPGFTIDGYRILGHSDRLGQRPHTKFIIFVEDEANQALLVTEDEIGGQRYKNAYFEQDEDKKFDFKDTKNLVTPDMKNRPFELSGFASNPYKTQIKDRIGHAYPEGYGLISFLDDGTRFIFDRTAMRKLAGKTADYLIQKFYEDRKLTPPWEVQPLALVERTPKKLAATPMNLKGKIDWINGRGDWSPGNRPKLLAGTGPPPAAQGLQTLMDMLQTLQLNTGTGQNPAPPAPAPLALAAPTALAAPDVQTLMKMLQTMQSNIMNLTKKFEVLEAEKAFVAAASPAS